VPKKIITVTDEMERVIQREASKRGAPFAAIIREAIVEWAEKRGITLEKEVTWGGPRKADDSEQGQSVAVAAS